MSSPFVVSFLKYFLGVKARNEDGKTGMSSTVQRCRFPFWMGQLARSVTVRISTCHFPPFPTPLNIHDWPIVFKCSIVTARCREKCPYPVGGTDTQEGTRSRVSGWSGGRGKHCGYHSALPPPRVIQSMFRVGLSSPFKPLWNCTHPGVGLPDDSKSPSRLIINIYY